MSVNRKIGLELQNGHDVGRDPRRMTGDELAALGHQRMGPLKALRLRCIDCSGGSDVGVRRCVLVKCPAWPFRMGTNPWRGAGQRSKRAKQASTITAEGPVSCRRATVRYVTETNCSEGPLPRSG